MGVFVHKCCIAVLFAAAMSSCKRNEQPKDITAVDTLAINNLIKEVIEEINNNYVDNISREKLEEGAISGMLSILDEHSMYINQEEFEAYNQSTRGVYLGIGAEIKQAKDGLEVVSVIEDSPAAVAGLAVNDIITHIGGKGVADMPIKDVYAKLGSDTAVKILLNVTRNKSQEFEVELKRSVIQLETVKHDFVDNIAVIRINCFNEGTANSLTSVIKKIKQKNSQGIVLDLRNNPGGLLEQAIEVANMFLDKNRKIVEFRSRNVVESRSVYSDSKDVLNGLPMAIIIDKNSASGAELVASALADNKRSVTIGEKSYGKGSLQTVIPIPGKGAIKLTTAFLFTPKGSSFNSEGVVPDIIVESSRDGKSNGSDGVLQRAVDLLRGISALDASTH